MRVFTIVFKIEQTCCLKFPNKVQSSCDLSLLTMNNLANDEKHDKNQIDEESFGIEEPHLACLVT